MISRAAALHNSSLNTAPQSSTELADARTKALEMETQRLEAERQVQFHKTKFSKMKKQENIVLENEL